MCWGPAPPKPSAGSGGTADAGCGTLKCPLNCPAKVEFKEHNTSYGFDDHTSAAQPWLSVEKGKTTTVLANVSPAGTHTNVEFTSAQAAKVTVSPATASSDAQVLTLTGVDNGESVVTAHCGGSARGKFNVKTFTRKSKTVAVRLVHETHYNSTDVADATITAFLKKVYDQAVFEFKLTRLPALTVAFDIDGDGKVDVKSWMSAEMVKIRDAAKDDSYDYNIFLVDNPNDGSLGYMDYNQKYGFVHAGAAAVPEMSVAHELGHGAFGLQHKNGDADNNMSQGDSASKWRLRKDQWDTINP